MSDVSEAALSKRNEELSAENASLKAENKDRRVRNQKATAELEALRSEIKTIAAERDKYQQVATAAPGEKDAQIADLAAKLTARDHRDAFAAVREWDGPLDPATGKAPKHRLAEGVTTDTLWRLTDYKAEGAMPDAKAITTILEKAVQAFPFMLATAETPADAGTRPVTVSARENGPGPGRGSTSQTVTASSTASAVRPATAQVEGRI